MDGAEIQEQEHNAAAFWYQLGEMLHYFASN